MSTVECQRCGFVNAAGTTLCQECLSSLYAGPREPEDPDRPPPPPEPPAEDDEGWRCPSCGTELGAGDAFCLEDGEPRTGAVRTGAGPAVPVAAAGLRLTLPGGVTLDVASGDRIDLGRDVDDPRVNRALTGRTGVSRRHVRLALQGDSVTVVDLGSTNGTWVNGQPVVDTVALPAVQLDRLDLGRNATVHVALVR